MSDAWLKIPPVRHAKYKKRNGSNELSIKLLNRIIELASTEGDIVFNPFGGSGSTYIVSEMKKRKWIGIEIGPCDGNVELFEKIENEVKYLERIRNNYNCLFTEKSILKKKEACGQLRHLNMMKCRTKERQDKITWASLRTDLGHLTFVYPSLPPDLTHISPNNTTRMQPMLFRFLRYRSGNNRFEGLILFERLLEIDFMIRMKT